MARTEIERLVSEYGDLILRIGYTYLSSLQDAEDLCQEVLVKLMSREEAFRDGERERAWVIRVSINACKDLLRSRRHRQTVSLDSVVEPAAPRAADRLVERETAGEVLGCVQRLPLKYREVVFLFYYQGFSVKRIAGLLGCKEDTVAQRLHRARKKLRPMLRERGIDGWVS